MRPDKVSMLLLKVELFTGNQRQDSAQNRVESVYTYIYIYIYIEFYLYPAITKKKKKLNCIKQKIQEKPH